MRSTKVILSFFAACAAVFGQQYLVSTIAGTSGQPGWSGDSGPALSAQFNNPIRVAVDKNLNLYITDYTNQSIRFVNYQTGIVNSIAGNGSLGYSGDGGNSVGAQLADPHDVVVDAAGNVYIADTLNARVRKIDTNQNINTIAGNGTYGYSGDGGAATNAQLTYPTGLAMDKAGNLYIADSGNATVRKVDTSGNITTIAGVGFTTFAAEPGDGGPANKAVLQVPYSVQVDSSGNLYIGDTGSSTIRRVDLTGKISTYLTSFPAQNFTIDASGAVYFTNYRNNTVEKVLPGGTRLVIAGDGIGGDTGDGGQGSQAQFNQPYGVALDATGNVYVADAFNAVIRELTPEPFSIGAVANSASVQAFAPPLAGSGDSSAPVAPGEIVLLFGQGLGPASLTVASPTKGLYPTQLSGTSVSFNGTAAPLIYASAGLVAAIVPYELNYQTSAQVAVTYRGNTSLVSTVPVAQTAPGLFTADSSGSGEAAAFNQDFTLNSIANPAPVGSIVILYGTGEGQTSPGGTDGKVNSASGLPPAPIQNVTATVGGVPAVIDYVGGVPTSVAGLFQINIEIPSGVPAGSTVPVVVSIGGVPSQTVTIAVSTQ